MRKDIDELTPRQIVEELDKYVIGQEKAKKAVAIALRNRTRRQKLPQELRDEIAPKNIIMSQTDSGRLNIMYVMMRERYESVRPRKLNMKNIGRIDATGGNILTESIQNERFSPPALLGQRANAYPASEPRMTDRAVEPTDIIKLSSTDRIAFSFTRIAL